MAPSHSRSVVCFCYFDAVISQTVEQGGVLRTAKRGMSFFRWPEVGFDSEMDLHISTVKPATAPLGELATNGPRGMLQV